MTDPTWQPPTDQQPAQPVEQQATPYDTAPAPNAAPAETAAPEPEPEETSSSAGVGSFVSWEVGEDGSDAVETFYGVVVEEDVELGLVDGEEARGTRVAVLHDLRVVAGDQLTQL